MPVAVVRPDPDEGDPGADGPVEGGVLVRRAVVRHLDDVDAGQLGARGGQEPPLRRLGEVAEVEEGQAPRGAPGPRPPEGHDARVVAGRDAGRRPGRPEDRPAEVAQEAAEARTSVDHLGPCHGEGVDEPLVGRPAGRADEHAVDPAHHDGGGAHVVGVEVGEHQQVDAVDAEPAQAAAERLLVVADVDERRPSRAADQHGIALPDVALGDRPVVGHGRALARAHPDDPASGDHEAPGQQERQHPPGRARRPGQHRPGRQHGQPDQDGEAEGSPGPLHPGQGPGGDRPGDGPDPRRGHPRRAGGELREPRRPGRGHTDDQAADGREGRGRLGQDVGDHPVDRQVGVEQQEHRLARELCRGGHGEHRRERAGQHAAEQVGRRPGEHDQARRRQDRQGEREVARQPRVDDEEAGDGQRDDGQPGHGPGRGEVPQHHERHDRGTDDARLGGDQHDEGDQEDSRRHEPQQARDAEGPADQHHEGHQDGAVRARHGREVREGRRLHRLVEALVDGGGVADGEAGQEPPPVAGQLGGDRPEPCAHRVGQACGTRGELARLDLAARRRDERDVVARLDGQHRDPGRQQLPDLDRRALGHARAEQEERRPPPPDDVPAHHDLAHRDGHRRRVADDPTPGLAAHLGRVAGEPDENVRVADLLPHGRPGEHESGDQSGQRDERGQGRDGGDGPLGPACPTARDDRPGGCPGARHEERGDQDAVQPGPRQGEDEHQPRRAGGEGPAEVDRRRRSHTVTRGRRVSSVFSPIPLTSSRSSTDRKEPFWRRQSRMAAEVAGPTPGRASS